MPCLGARTSEERGMLPFITGAGGPSFLPSFLPCCYSLPHPTIHIRIYAPPKTGLVHLELYDNQIAHLEVSSGPLHLQYDSLLNRSSFSRLIDSSNQPTQP